MISRGDVIARNRLPGREDDNEVAIVIAACTLTWGRARDVLVSRAKFVSLSDTRDSLASLVVERECNVLQARKYARMCAYMRPRRLRLDV